MKFTVYISCLYIICCKCGDQDMATNDQTKVLPAKRKIIKSFTAPKIKKFNESQRIAYDFREVDQFIAETKQFLDDLSFLDNDDIESMDTDALQKNFEKTIQQKDTHDSSRHYNGGRIQENVINPVTDCQCQNNIEHSIVTREYDDSLETQKEK